MEARAKDVWTIRVLEYVVFGLGEIAFGLAVVLKAHASLGE